MARRYYECVVCGRRFPEGQGISLEKAGRVLWFHSRRCAYRFFMLLMERVEDSCISAPMSEVLEELGRLRRERWVEKVI